MSSRDKENKSLQDKFKQFFKRAPSIKPRSSFELTEDIQRDIGKDTHISQRIKRLKELNERILSSNLDTDTIAKLWGCIEDIFSLDQSELRNTAFIFLKNLVKRQNEELKITRAHFFRFVKNHNIPEDLWRRLQLLKALTSNGRCVQHFEEEIGPFLVNWFPDIQQANKMAEYLDLILNIIKFNAVCLESSVLTELVQLICILCCSSSDDAIVNYCLQILDSFIAYSNMPSDSLQSLIGALCRSVTNEKYCQLSWKVGRNLLGTHMGHSALYTLCLILQEPALKSETQLLRGAIFFIHMSLWSTKAVANLCCPPSSVLPSFVEAVKSDHPLICYEAMLGIQALILKFGNDLQHVVWGDIMEIIHHVNNSVENNLGQPTSTLILVPFHETLNAIEVLIATGRFNGSAEKFFNIIDMCAHSRPENSVLRLIEYLSRYIVPTEHFWLSNLNALLNKHFKLSEIRTTIRLAALETLANIAYLNRRDYEEELLGGIVIPHCLNVITDSSIVIRTSVCKMLLRLCMNCETKKCVEMLEVLEKFMFRPFEIYVDCSPSETELTDVLFLVKELINVFVHKIHRTPSTHAIKIYTMLVCFLEMHYKKPLVFANCYEVRYLIFDCFLKMRANDKYNLGYPKDAKISYSPYLCVTGQFREKGNVSSPLPQSPAIAGQHGAQYNVTFVSIKRAFRIFITCLQQEKDYNIVRMVLQELPKIMKNKPLILSKYGNIELDVLVDVLSPTILDKLVLPDHLAKKMSKQEYLTAHLLILVTLPSYHSCLDQKHQQCLVRCLSRCIGNSLRTNPKQLLNALTICCLEMRDVMIKMLPEILLTISKISPTTIIAIPILEFLSTLTQLPMVYASFVDDQYMAVFAITSPFTNPFKYNHYTVSLAHYVIGVWFLKCRLPIRRNFVRFITSGLQTNILTPFEETNLVPLHKHDFSKLNLDSSDRKRSSSLTEQGPRRRAATVSGGSGSATSSGTSAPLHIPVTAANAPTITFYEELTETCIDLMARYAFSPCSALPRRTPIADFILSGGQSMSWLLGHKLITITTSGCSQKALKHGLCDKCLNICSSGHQLPLSARSDSIENTDVTKVFRESLSEKTNSPVDEMKKPSEEKRDEVPHKLEDMVTPDSDKYEKPLCACWCQSWAEIFVRRPTGDMSWVMRIQNTLSSKSLISEFPLKELTNLFMSSMSSTHENVSNPSGSRTNSSEETTTDDSNRIDKEEQSSYIPMSIPTSPARQSPSRQSSGNSAASEDIENIYDDGSKLRNPVRRSNSSPEMSNWKNPFLHSKHDDDKSQEDDFGKKGKLYSKDMRVSCEAIPEEIAGTTPPSSDAVLPPLAPAQTAQHPSLLTCHSYPGSSPPVESNKAYQTVPASPSVLAVASQPFPPKSSLSKNSSSDLSTESVKSDKDKDQSKNLGVLSKLQPVSSKPPQSPTQTTQRIWTLKDKEVNEIQKSASASVLDKNTSLNVQDKIKGGKTTGSVDRITDIDPQKRDRTHTVAGTSLSTRRPRSEQLKQLNMRPREAPKSGINPSLIFLQMYQRVDFADFNERPLLIGADDAIRRAISVLDQIPPYETHKIGVIYVRDGQIDKEAEILRNCFGSIRYGVFLKRLGNLFKLQDVDPQLFFLGGLAQTGEDGIFSYIWQDDLVKMIFHVATLMPNKESDPNCNAKKLHIGNDNVTIVYNESDEEYNITTIRSQFNFASIIIHPMDHSMNRVTLKCKKELIDLTGWDCQETHIVSDQNVAILARQLALHANLASLVFRSISFNSQNPYASNWLERLRQIKKIRTRLIDSIDGSSPKETAKSTTKTKQKQMEDFTEYT
ncbi:hypothetical protein WA026_000595 [Henosepilachna vigintioctopunctata]|uniref:Rap-GAP domain-containing protein n=1 Tax=Henosepilachna vigintioctopunctata TaxID=420089 RepID=A0AAW1V0Y1_9CUCU